MRSTKDVDHRSDIWALGTILFELLTAKHAWLGATLSEVCVRVASDPAPLAKALRPELPGAIDVVIQKCLAKEPSGRFQTVLELARALAPFADGNATTLLQRMSRLVGLNSNAVSPPEVVTSNSPNLAKQANSAGHETDLSWHAGATANNFSRKRIWTSGKVIAVLVLVGAVTAFLAVAHYSNRSNQVASHTVTSAANSSSTVDPVTQGTAVASPETGALPARANAAGAPAIAAAAIAPAAEQSSASAPVVVQWHPRTRVAETQKSTSAGTKHTEQLVPAAPEATTQSKPKLPDNKLPAWGGRE